MFENINFGHPIPNLFHHTLIKNITYIIVVVVFFFVAWAEHDTKKVYNKKKNMLRNFN